MNQTEYPSLNKVVEGISFPQTELVRQANPDQKACEIACVDLICKLENWLARAMALDHDDFIDESSDIALKLLKMLTTFSNEHLQGAAEIQIKDEVDRASTLAHAYLEILKTRSLTNAVIRTFWKVEETQDILEYHAKLGESLVRSCAATCYHAVILVGLDTDFGREIDESTVHFVNELQQRWV